MHADSPQHNGRKPLKPLDSAALNELALAYVARFATSAGKLSAYLLRKVRERGWQGEEAPDVAAIVSRFVALGYIDDAGFARARGGSLLRRGYGERRVAQALDAAGIAAEDRGEAIGTARERRQAALVLARKRRFGPFSRVVPDPAMRERQVAAMLRAGHPLATARVLVNAASIEDAENWVEECDDD